MSHEPCAMCHEPVMRTALEEQEERAVKLPRDNKIVPRLRLMAGM